MKFEIKSRFDGSLLFALETESMKLCVEAAVKQRAYLQDADLQGAYLRSAYLQRKYNRSAYLQGSSCSCDNGKVYQDCLENWNYWND